MGSPVRVSIKMKANALWLLRICLYMHLSTHVWAYRCSTWLSNDWAAQSLICHPLRSADMKPKQADTKTERKASLCSPACSLFWPCLGSASLADSNELPWVPFYRHLAARGWGWWGEGQGWHQYTHANICTQRQGTHQPDTNFPEQTDVRFLP